MPAFARSAPDRRGAPRAGSAGRPRGSPRRPRRCRRGRGGSAPSSSSVSSSSQAARGSPSRGWPTLPGLSSQLAARRGSSTAPSPAWAPWASPRRAAVRAGEEERDVGVADQPDPLLLRVAGPLRPGRSRARTPRSGRGARRGRGRCPSRAAAGSSPRRNSRVAALAFSRVHSTAAARGLREGGDVELAEHREVVVADQADVAALADQVGAGVGLGAVADDVAEAPDLLDAGLVDRREDGLEGGQVGVDVADDGCAQAASVPVRRGLRSIRLAA